MSESNVSVSAIKQALIEGRDRRQDVVAAMKARHETVCVIKANTPGYPKNTTDSAFLLRLFKPLVQTVFSPHEENMHPNDAGDFIVFATKEAAPTAKQHALFIEENHPLGRFIDIDVYGEKILSRSALKRPMRRCYLCTEPAQQCARLKTHRYDRMRKAIALSVRDYLVDAMTDQAVHAMRRELFVYPKLGLVSRQDAGAHADMDYRDFLRSMAALKPYFKTFAAAAFHEKIDIGRLREAGIKAERAMFVASGGVNTHKGMIFILGCALPFLTRAAYEGNSLQNALAAMQSAVKPLIVNDFAQVPKKTHLTAGEKIYKDYGIQGVRGEVAAGFPSLLSWYPQPTWSDVQRLCAIMARLDDTTVVKRHNLGTLKSLKREMQALMNATPFNVERYKTLSDNYKKNGVSPGGAADMLALSFLFDNISHLLG